MGNKTRSEKDMQTLTLSCHIQQTSEGEGGQHQGLAAAQVGAWAGIVWAGFGGPRVGFWEKLPEACVW